MSEIPYCQARCELRRLLGVRPQVHVGYLLSWPFVSGRLSIYLVVSSLENGVLRMFRIPSKPAKPSPLISILHVLSFEEALPEAIPFSPQFPLAQSIHSMQQPPRLMGFPT